MPWARAPGSFGCDEQARHPVLDGFRGAADPRRDHGNAGGHGLEQHVGQPFAERGQYRHRDLRQDLGHVEPEAREDDPPLEPEARDATRRAPRGIPRRRAPPAPRSGSARPGAWPSGSRPPGGSPRVPCSGSAETPTATSGQPSGSPSSRRSPEPSAGCRKRESSTPFGITVILASSYPSATSHCFTASAFTTIRWARRHTTRWTRSCSGVRYTPMSRIDAMTTGVRARRAAAIANTLG